MRQFLGILVTLKATVLYAACAYAASMSQLNGYYIPDRQPGNGAPAMSNGPRCPVAVGSSFDFGVQVKDGWAQFTVNKQLLIDPKTSNTIVAPISQFGRYRARSNGIKIEGKFAGPDYSHLARMAAFYGVINLTSTDTARKPCIYRIILINSPTL